jgi:hypothetical protein
MIMKSSFYLTHQTKQIFYIVLLCACMTQNLLFAGYRKNEYVHFNYPARGERHGMFSILRMVLGLLYLYEEGKVAGVKIDFMTKGIYYDPSYGPNWWEYYFEPVDVRRKNCKYRITKARTWGYLCRLGEYTVTRTRAFELLQKYFILKPHIQEKLETFQRERFGDAFVIGVHYRGTDKYLEAPRVSYEIIRKEIDRIVENICSCEVKIFVATDEQAFLDYIKEQFPNVIFRENVVRSIDGHPVHFDNLANFKKGEDALLDCLLLSKCQILIRGASNLSLFASFFNPQMRLINLNCKYKEMQDPDNKCKDGQASHPI